MCVNQITLGGNGGLLVNYKGSHKYFSSGCVMAADIREYYLTGSGGAQGLYRKNSGDQMRNGRVGWWTFEYRCKNACVFSG